MPWDRCLSLSWGGIPFSCASPPPQEARRGLQGDAGRVVLLLRDDFFAPGALEARATGTDMGPAAGAFVLARWVTNSWGGHRREVSRTQGSQQHVWCWGLAGAAQVT